MCEVGLIWLSKPGIGELMSEIKNLPATYLIEVLPDDTAVTKVRTYGEHFIYPGIIDADPVCNAIMQANQRAFGAMLHRISELIDKNEEDPRQFEDAISDFEDKYGEVES